MSYLQVPGEYEVRDAKGVSVRVNASSEEDALSWALDAYPELDEGSIYLASDPVGVDADPE